MSQLEIQTLRIENYRQYAGINEIDLKTNKSKNINVIQGQNGAGKSNILNAITLCLYGKESHLEEAEANELDTYPYISSSELEKLDINEEATGKIEITMGDSEPRYIFTREFQSVKIADAHFNSSHGDLKLKEKQGNDWKLVENVSTRLNQILPRKVHQYFLFDGEQLDKFFAEGYQERVRDGLLDVSHIELLERGISHLNKFETTVENRLTNSGSNVEQKEAEYREAQQNLETVESKLSQTNIDIENVNSQIIEIDDKLRNSSIEVVREKQQRRDGLEERLNEIRSEEAHLRTEIGKNILKAGPAMYTQKPLNEALGVLENLSEAGRLPPKIQETFVQELLDSGQCICGEELEEKNRVHLQNLEREMSKVDESNLEGQFAIPSVIKEASEAVREIKNQRQKLADIEQKASQTDERLKNINEEFDSFGIPDDINIKHLEEVRRNAAQELENLNEIKGKLKAKIEQCEREVSKLENDWKDLLTDKKENQRILDQIDFIRNSRNKIETIKTEILTSVRAEMNERMNRYFNDVVWKDENYNIELSEDYSVKVLNDQGSNIIGSLAKGESQVLAFSFLAALTSVSGFSAPLVLDTPLGRISSTPKARLAKNLPEYINESQMTFLMTDEEYTDKVRMNMSPYVSNEYKLDLRNKDTEVVPYE